MANIAITGLPALRYHAARNARATKWAEDWRQRWFRQVGSVHQHYATKELVAFYSDDRDPAVRLALQQELEAHPNGPAQVLAVCRKVMRDWDRRIEAGRA
ncbi:hypothetical protein [Novosphingobium sp.]|uniref:hypothetical protein n=1 Tax=Novosphingobium sp. TaxID=1874826 RepID=UPI002FDA807F